MFANIITFIIMLALIFGIINTMLMAVLERTKEFGMLMAVGMRRFSVFKMIIFETLILVMTAAPVGMLLGFLTIYYFGTYDVDFNKTNPGVWTMTMDHFKQSSGFTSWTEYKKDEPMI